MSAPLSDHGVSAPRPDRLRSSLTRPKHAELLTWHILRTARDADVPIKIFANEDPEEVVIAFCAEHMADAGESCSGQLLPHVLKKMEEFENSIAGIDGAEEQ